METLEGALELLRAVRFDIVHHTRGRGLDIGRGPYKAFPHFIALREKGDPLIPAERPMDYMCETFESGLADFEDGSLDFVFAWGDVVVPRDEVIRVLNVGGRYVSCIAHFRDVHTKQGPDNENELLWTSTAGWHDTDHQKTACVVRYGAIGDALQAACVLPELKRQGYHVTYMCEPLGEVVMRADPNIDRFLVQDPDQVPNHELPLYFAHWKPKFDKWVNLCESIEGTLICLPGRAKFEMPQKVRHQLCNHNYHEMLCDLAEIPLHAEHHFYPTDEEAARATQKYSDIASAVNDGWTIGQTWRAPYVVLFALSGSGIHKFYPHQDAIIARILMEIPEAHVILTGGTECKILEVGWENEPRVHCTSGEMALRDTLALARVCDLVIGPETGTLNCVAFESNAKVVLLSHSSAENLTKHWVNTEALSTKVTPCYPCHQLHQDRTACPQHPGSGSALCQWELDPVEVWAAVYRAYQSSRTVKKILEPA